MLFSVRGSLFAVARGFSTANRDLGTDSVLPIDYHDGGRRAGGSEVVAEANGLHARGFQAKFDQALTHGEGSAVGQGTGMILGKVRWRVTGDQQTGLRLLLILLGQYADGLFMGCRKLQGVIGKLQCWAGGLEAGTERRGEGVTRSERIHDGFVGGILEEGRQRWQRNAAAGGKEEANDE